MSLVKRIGPHTSVVYGKIDYEEGMAAEPAVVVDVTAEDQYVTLHQGYNTITVDFDHMDGIIAAYKKLKKEVS